MEALRIAWVEDSPDQIEAGKEYLKRYSEKRGVELRTDFYVTAEDFLKNYQFSYDIVLMDIELPGMDGMKAASELRRMDKDVILMFITNLSKLAAKGYEVDALDYILKPLSYPHFELKMNRALDRYLSAPVEKIEVESQSKVILLPVNRIKYVEVINHHLYYHLMQEKIEVRSTLKQAEKKLAKYGFLKCNACYLVNPRFIREIDKYEIDLGGEKILISHPKKKQFMEDFMNYVLKKE